MDGLTQEHFPNTGNLYEIWRCAEDQYLNVLSCYQGEPDYEEDLDRTQDIMNKAYDDLCKAANN